MSDEEFRELEEAFANLARALVESGVSFQEAVYNIKTNFKWLEEYYNEIK